MSALVAIYAYGKSTMDIPDASHRRGQKQVSTLKMSRMDARILQSILGERARDLSSSRSRYAYLYVGDDVPKLREGWLFVKVSDTQIRTLENQSKHSEFSSVYLWKDGQWYMFPSAKQDYQNAEKMSSGPRQSPLGFWALDAEEGGTDKAGRQDKELVTAEYSKQSSGPAWWWILGNTYPIRHQLKQARARWARRRGAWYYVGDQLPEAILRLLDNREDAENIMAGRPPISVIPKTEIEAEADAPCSDEEAEAILGLNFRSNPQKEALVSHDFVIDEIVYYCGLEPKTSTCGTIHFGAWGKVIERHNRDKQVLVDFQSHGECFLEEQFLSKTKPIRPHSFQLGQTVYTAHLLRINETLKLNSDSEGKIVRRYKYRSQAKHSHYAYGGEYAYDVLFEGQVYAVPVFQENLKDHADKGGRFQADERFPIIAGVSAQEIIQAAMQRRQAIPQTYEILDELTADFQFRLGQQVYTKLGSGLKLEDGIVQGRYQNCKNGQGKLENAYLIMGAHNQFKVFESELSPEAPQAFTIVEEILSPDLKRKIEAERQQADTAQAIARQEIGSQAEPEACPCEAFGTKGWYPSPNLGGWTECNLCNPEGINPPEDQEGEKAAPAIRIFKVNENSETLANAALLDAAIQSSKNALPSPEKAMPIRQKPTGNIAIEQRYVGRLSGSVDADVHCYGYASHAGICIYLNMAGPRSGVEAIRAKLAKGDVVNLSPWEGPSLELTAGEGITGMYEAELAYIKEARFLSCILVHKDMLEANYAGAGQSYLFHVSLEQAQAQLYQHIQKLLKIAVFPEWTAYLWQAGQAAMLLSPCRGAGGLKVFALSLDSSAWTRLITGAIAQNIIQLPQTSA